MKSFFLEPITDNEKQKIFRIFKLNAPHAREIALKTLEPDLYEKWKWWEENKSKISKEYF